MFGEYCQGEVDEEFIASVSAPADYCTNCGPRQHYFQDAWVQLHSNGVCAKGGFLMLENQENDESSVPDDEEVDDEPCVSDDEDMGDASFMSPNSVPADNCTYCGPRHTCHPNVWNHMHSSGRCMIGGVLTLEY